METSRAVLSRDGNRLKHVGCPGVRRAYIKGLKPRSEELGADRLHVVNTGELPPTRTDIHTEARKKKDEDERS